MAQPLEAMLGKARAWRRTHLIGIDELTKEEILLLLECAKGFQAQRPEEQESFKPLKGKCVFTLFVEPSTRTKVSFTLASRALGADLIDISPAMSSLTKGETLRDTVERFEAMGANFIIVRHHASGAAHQISRWVQCSVINAGDGSHEHPTQALLDALTIEQALGRLNGLSLVIVGDIAYSRVARSNIFLHRKFGNKITVVGPPTLMPHSIEKLGVAVSYDLDAALQQCDAVMVLRLQLERQQAGLSPSLQEYRRLFGLTRERWQALSPRAVILHPGPMNRGIEIDSDVADSKQSLILKQVENGTAMRKAILLALSEAQKSR